ncbi:hypothetical protein M5X00_26200 [Paenibacillus alvei]|uniref:hypothetical protein n=1 Tax=Paenibacillus alvei TaxID=44250 RepID=UPI00227EF7F7|nr:hypothetical protein [Paenibacillus alvei]MCY9757724.1 hypothetical protein [Paenibacillus alvei]
MIKYTVEESENNSTVYLNDDEYGIKVVVAMVFDKAHARIIARKLNEYYQSRTLEVDTDPFLEKGLAKVIPH